MLSFEEIIDLPKSDLKGKIFKANAKNEVSQFI